MANTESICFIPARAGSRRLPGKNFRPFYKRFSLMELAIAQAVEFMRTVGTQNSFDTIYVSTDNDSYVGSSNLGVKVLRVDRPPELADDKTPADVVMWETLKEKGAKPEWAYLLQPTNPFRTIRSLVQSRNSAQNDSFVHFSYTPQLIYPLLKKHGLASGQDQALNGNFLVFEQPREETPWTEWVTSFPHKVSPIEHIDIDTKEDWDLAKALLKTLDLSEYLGYSLLDSLL